MKTSIDYIEILLKIKKENQCSSFHKNYNLSSSNSFEENLTELLKQFAISTELYCGKPSKYISFSKEMENYLSALISSIDMAEKNSSSYITIDNNPFKDKFSSLHKHAFLNSECNVLVHSLNNNCINIST